MSFGVLLYAVPPHSCPKRPRAFGHFGDSVVYAYTSPLAFCFGSRTLLRSASTQGGTKQNGFSFDKRVNQMPERNYFLDCVRNLLCAY